MLDEATLPQEHDMDHWVSEATRGYPEKKKRLPIRLLFSPLLIKFKPVRLRQNRVDQLRLSTLRLGRKKKTARKSHAAQKFSPDRSVTVVQTVPAKNQVRPYSCAARLAGSRRCCSSTPKQYALLQCGDHCVLLVRQLMRVEGHIAHRTADRSEERRVGKECRL